ncbi:MAG: DUF2085 domain-containing protein [Thaumarchaeota archaeon]|nr:DUF2085 domain-containing protein [Nitrososphaerota archaeon]MCZ6616272.1 DUF2085 domain-containing protein [Nitrososphaerota archaeon]MCZ6725531.1 DUF2085 domain-containing protein [Nitrososphaerota archaeon]
MRQSLSLILAHNHYLSISLGRNNLRLCARCSGVVLGFTMVILLEGLLAIYSYVTLNAVMVPIVMILAVPASIDWITQCWGNRHSDNRTRLLTGLLLGVGIGLASLLDLPSLTKYMLVGGTGGIVIMAGFVGKSLRIKN